MAGDWIKMRGNLWDDPRVASLVDATDTSEAQVIGGLYWLWATADQHTEDGCMPGLTLRQIDRKTGIPGFGAALVAIGWLADDPQGVVLTNFTEHNGASAKRRATDAQRKANGRNASASDADKSRNEGGQDAPDLGAREREREREEKEKRDSVANATGTADAPPGKTPMEQRKSDAWKAVKSMLNEHGMPKAQTGAFIGKLVGDFGEAAVLTAMESAVVQRPAEPAAWLSAACQHAGGQRHHANKQEALEASNNAVVQRLLAKEAAHAT